MDSKTIDISMELIGLAGEARGTAIRALKFAKKGEIAKAESLAKQAQETLYGAHRLHAQIISEEAAGQKWDIQTLFIHAQDHFANALVILDLLEYIIDLYKEKNSK